MYYIAIYYYLILAESGYIMRVANYGYFMNGVDMMDMSYVFINEYAQNGFALGIGSMLTAAIFLPVFTYMGKAFFDYFFKKK